MQRSIDVAAHAGTAFDGQHLFQIAEDRIHKIDPKTGKVLATIPAPGNGGNSGMAWAEGSLWVGQHRGRKIHQIDPETGKILRTIESNRVVTGVTWADGELWHGTWEGDESDVRRIDPKTGEVLERLEMPAGTGVSGLEVRWRRSVLLRRRQQRQGESHPSAKHRVTLSSSRRGLGASPGAVSALRNSPIFHCRGEKLGGPRGIAGLPCSADSARHWRGLGRSANRADVKCREYPR